MKDQIHHWKKALDWLKDCNNGTLQHSTKIILAIFNTHQKKPPGREKTESLQANMQRDIPFQRMFFVIGRMHSMIPIFRQRKKT